MLTDAAGTPLAVTTTAANVNEIRAALPTLMAVPPVGGKPGPKRTLPKSLVADAAYRSAPLRAILCWLGVRPQIPDSKRDAAESGLGALRWPIERTLSWFHQFRRLGVRWDRRLDNHMAFLKLAAVVICWRKLKAARAGSVR